MRRWKGSGTKSRAHSKLGVCFGFCLGEAYYEPDHTVCMVHFDCWRFARLLEPGQHLNPSIYHLGRSTTKLFAISHPDYAKVRQEEICTFTEIPLPYNKESHVGILLEPVSRIPADIQVVISKMCVGSFLSTLVSVCQRKAGLNLRPSADESANSWLSSTSYIQLDGTLFGIKPRWTKLYGQVYISDLEPVTLERAGQIPDCLPIAGIKGLNFALGPYGIRALKILYADNTESTWVGSLSGCWFGSVVGDNIGALKNLKDDVKCIRIDLMHSTKAPMPSQKHHIMWNREITGVQDIHCYDFESRIDCEIDHYPSWRPQCSNALFRDNEYVHGITMYCSTNHNIHGFVTHGRSDVLTGGKNSAYCAIHLPLRSGEMIQDIFIQGYANTRKTSKVHLASLVPMLVTTRGRICTPFLEVPFFADASPRYSWTRMGKPNSPITSIFHEPHTVGGPGLTTLGYAMEKPEYFPAMPSLKHRPVFPISPRPHRCFNDLFHFVSIAQFQDVRRINIRHVRGRCKGLWIEHDNGFVDILGQWDPSYPLEVSQLYCSEQGRLKSVNFYLKEEFPQAASGDEDSEEVEDESGNSDDGNNEAPERPDDRERFVDRIIVHTEDQRLEPLNAASDEEVLAYTDLTQHIAWWFGYDHDHVKLWNGMFEEIELKSKEDLELAAE